MKTSLLVFLFLACATLASAQTSSVPPLMSYQGHVTDVSGTPIGNDTPVNRTMTFRFYSTSTDGVPLYAEEQTVTISGGAFSVLLGNGTGVPGLPGPSAPAATPYITLPSIMEGPLYLGITVDDGTAAEDAEIGPRQQIVSGAFALRAQLAEGLVDGALSTSMLADAAVTTNKIGGGQVTAAKIADGNITTIKILDSNVTTAKIADGAVTTAKLASGSVTNAILANGSVTGEKIQNGTIVSADIADNTITSADIGDGQVATVDLANAAVTSAKIANGAIDYAKLAAAVQQTLVPVGTIVPFAGDTAPPGWILCHGTVLNRTTYADLFAVIGTRFGSTGGDNFRTPDLRGVFLRGRDAGAGRDPDRNSRTSLNGGATGDRVGSYQSDMLGSHRHSVPNDSTDYDVNGNYKETNQNSLVESKGSDENYSFNPGTGYTGGSETRPKNVSVNYIIKY